MLMLSVDYLSAGERTYGSQAIPLNIRGRWEFQIILEGSAVPSFSYPSEWTGSVPVLHCFAPDNLHGWTDLPEARSRVCVLHLPTIPRSLEDILAGRDWYQIGLNKDLAEMVYADSLRALQASEQEREAEAQFLSLQAFFAIAARIAESLPAPEASHRSESLVRRAIAWFEEHMHQAPGLEDIAHAHHCSTSTLHRAFAASHMGPPKQVLLELRMNRAKLLLATTTLSIREICYAVGYSDQGGFTRAFRLKFGMTPGAFRSSSHDESRQGKGT